MMPRRPRPQSMMELAREVIESDGAGMTPEQILELAKKLKDRASAEPSSIDSPPFGLDKVARGVRRVRKRLRKRLRKAGLHRLLSRPTN